MSDRISQHYVGGAVAWASQAAALSVLEEEALADVDEPPDHHHLKYINTSCYSAASAAPTTLDLPAFFHRETIRRPSVQQARSLLTIALKNQDDPATENDDDVDSYALECQRSLSMSSAADLTSDTGFTSPSRANTPSPPPPDMVHVVPSVRRPSVIIENLNAKKRISFVCSKPVRSDTTEKPKTHTINFAYHKPTGNDNTKAPKARGITFVYPKPLCPAATSTCVKPQVETSTITVPSEPVPRPRCIKFVANEKLARPTRNRCISPPPTTPVSPAVKQTTGLPVTLPSSESASASTIQAPTPPVSPLELITPLPKRPKKLQIDESGLKAKKQVPFTAFVPEQVADKWAAELETPRGRRITINDTLSKELTLRRLAKEVSDEEEAENTSDVGDDEEDDEEPDEDEEEDQDEDDDYDSDGYHTDEETGFAESDDEDDDLHLWVLTNSTPVSSSSRDADRKIVVAPFSIDSSETSRLPKRQRQPSIRPGTPDLPDSTDFVFGTFDEDRPLESAYLSCREQRRRKKLHLIPQDIDPSFPASDPENETEDIIDALISSVSGETNLDEIVAEARGRRKSKNGSPKLRYHSPPPKKMGRGKSPAPPRRVGNKSPMIRPRNPTLGVVSPLVFLANPAALPPPRCVIPTKSLPRPLAFAPTNKYRKGHRDDDNDYHVRGAIDIMKGLEHKRNKRKEKLYKEYCNRARKGQNTEPYLPPGKGAEKMKVIGLLHAGKNIQQVKAELHQPEPQPKEDDSYMISV